MKKVATWSLITLAASIVLTQLRIIYFDRVEIVNPSATFTAALGVADALLGLGILLPIAALASVGAITLLRRLSAHTNPATSRRSR